MIESLNSSVLDQSSSVSDDSTRSTADVLVDFEYFLDRFRNNNSGLQSPLGGEDNPLSALDSDSR